MMENKVVIDLQDYDRLKDIEKRFFILHKALVKSARLNYRKDDLIFEPNPEIVEIALQDVYREKFNELKEQG